MTYAQRQIELTFELGGSETFTPNGDNTVTLADHRISVSITNVVGPATGEARIAVYGLAPTLLNKLASLNQASAAAQRNRVIVRAGDAKKGLAIAFDGQIMLAQANMDPQPQTYLNLLAAGTGLQSILNIEPTAYPGSADAAVILQNLATRGGLAFKNWGASKILQDAYSWGDLRAQINDYCDMAGFDKVIENKTLEIWPREKFRGGQVPLISAETGLIGYPGYSSWAQGGGISVKTEFNPDLQIGGRAEVKSGLPVANGTWLIFFLSHELECQVPGGQWFSQFHGSGFGNV